MNATAGGSAWTRLREALACADLESKPALVKALAEDAHAGRLQFDREPLPGDAVRGVPRQLRTVAPGDLTRRGAQTREGLAALYHAVAHIEYTAIDLALDHAWRFREFPEEYYPAWMAVAAEEAQHFALLRSRLRHLGHDYGDFPVHASLWEMARRTETDALARMALVPRLMEARGLDATPPIQEKLRKAGDAEGIRVLDIVLHDEIGHVALGDQWYRWLCKERGLEPEATFRELIDRYGAPWPTAPLNEAARLAAGFSAGELAALARNRRAGGG